jgi:UDP-glucuronate decarboxylase
MDTPGYVTGPMNLGNPTEFTIRERAQKLMDLTGSASVLVHKPLPADDPRQRKPDVSLAMAQLGWAPEVSLAEGLVPTIAYFDALIR